MSMRNTFSTRLRAGLFAAVATLGLAGCADDQMAMDDTFVPYSPSERYPISYAKGPVTMQVDSKHGTLQPTQVNAVAGFARQAKAGGLTPITVRRPSGGGKSSRVAEEIAGVLLQQGVPDNMIRMATYPAGAGSPVQIGYVKAYAHTKPCGEWDANVADTGSNQRFTNHGCAVQSNIAAMIANPEDIVKPSNVSPGMATGSTTAIRNLGQDSSGPRSIFDLF